MTSNNVKCDWVVKYSGFSTGHPCRYARRFVLVLTPKNGSEPQYVCRYHVGQMITELHTSKHQTQAIVVGLA